MLAWAFLFRCGLFVARAGGRCCGGLARSMWQHSVHPSSHSTQMKFTEKRQVVYVIISFRFQEASSALRTDVKATQGSVGAGRAIIRRSQYWRAALQTVARIAKIKSQRNFCGTCTAKYWETGTLQWAHGRKSQAKNKHTTKGDAVRDEIICGN